MGGNAFLSVNIFGRVGIACKVWCFEFTHPNRKLLCTTSHQYICQFECVITFDNWKESNILLFTWYIKTFHTLIGWNYFSLKAYLSVRPSIRPSVIRRTGKKLALSISKAPRIGEFRSTCWGCSFWKVKLNFAKHVLPSLLYAVYLLIALVSRKTPFSIIISATMCTMQCC